MGPSQTTMVVDCAPFTGGAQRSLLTLLHGVAARGWSPAVLSADHTPGGLLESCRGAGWPVRELRTAHWQRSAAGMARYAWDRLAVRRPILIAARRWQPALIHANGIRAGLLVPRALGRQAPLVLHDRDLRVPDLALRLLAPRLAEVIAISQAVAVKWAAFPEVPLRVIPNGFDLAPMAATTPVSDPALAAARLRVVMVADMVPWKRHGAFLEALALASREQDGLVGVLVGRVHGHADAGYLQRLRVRAADLGVDGRLIVVTDATSALPWLAAADVVVSAAVEEPFGRTIVEALALGRPVVAVQAAGPSEILAGCQAATLTGPTPADLAAGILQWREPSRRAAAARAARAWAGRYDQSRMADAVCALYWDVAGGPAR